MFIPAIDPETEIKITLNPISLSYAECGWLEADLQTFLERLENEYRGLEIEAGYN